MSRGMTSGRLAAAPDVSKRGARRRENPAMPAASRDDVVPRNFRRGGLDVAPDPGSHALHFVSRRKPALSHAAYDRFRENSVDWSVLRWSEEKWSCRNRSRTVDRKGGCQAGGGECGVHIGLQPILP